MLAEIPVNFPDLATQKRIAAELREKMETVAAARKAIEVQRETVGALVASWVLEGTAHKETRWEPVGETMLEVKQGVGSRWQDYPVLGATRNGLALAKEPPGKYPERYKPVLPGTVFYNPMRILIGSIAMVDDGGDAGITSPDYVAVRPAGPSVLTNWFYEWLRSPLGEAFISGLARGAVRERMLFSRLKEGIMPLPPLSWQEKFQDLVRDCRKAQALLNEQLAAANALPAAYLREVFGGIA